MNLSSNQRYYLGAAAVILAMLIATVVAYPQLPNTVPIHWNAHGQANGWGPKWSPAQIEETMSPAALEKMSSWILKQSLRVSH